MSEKTMPKNPLYEGPYKLTGKTYLDAGGSYQLAVKDHFDAAHALPGYDGPCQYVHGHTWDVEVVVEGTHLDEVGLLCDFKDIKSTLHALLENFDHHYINDVPPFDEISPTAEHLARVLYFELAVTLPEGINLQELAVWESPMAKVVFRP